MVEIFAPHRKTNRLLDIGYGAGVLLDAAESVGWEVWGTEISEAAPSRGTWNVRWGELPELDLPTDFDVVVVVEVLEHLPDPRSYLQAARRLLRPGGLLFGTTPNGRGLSARILRTGWTNFAAPEHLQLFSPRGLSKLLGECGFSNPELIFSGLNPYELIRMGRGGETFDRVGSSYELNERLETSVAGGALKRGANRVLNAGRLGDTMKFRTEPQQ